MNAIPLLIRRLAERRFLKDGATDASLLPGALSTLAFSTLVSSLVIGELDSRQLAVVAACAVCAWSLLRALLEAGEQDADAVDAAILDPLPIRRFDLAAARAVVAGIGVAIDASNLTLPLIVMVGCTEGLIAALRLASVVALSLAFGVLLAAPARRALRRVFSAFRVAESEGPLRMTVLISGFVVLARAPDIPWSRLLDAPWCFVPPFSFAAAAFGAGAGVVAAASAAVGIAAGIAAAGDRGRVVIGGARRTRIGFLASRVRRSCESDSEQAGFDFALASIRSDRAFRARTFPLLAFPFAAIVMAGLDRYDATLVPMALFGATVYLVLSEVFLLFSESASGPELLSSLPISEPWSFRIGAEKAFLLAIVLPTHLAISFGIGAFDLVRGDLASFLDHAILGAAALLASTLIVLLAFDRLAGLPFSRPDRALYPDDLTAGAYFALALATIAALVSASTLGTPWKSALLFSTLLLLIRVVLRRKRRRCRAPTTNA